MVDCTFLFFFLFLFVVSPMFAITTHHRLRLWDRTPDNAKIKDKMVAASSRDALRRSLQGIAIEIQGTDDSEVAYETGVSYFSPSAPSSVRPSILTFCFQSWIRQCAEIDYLPPIIVHSSPAHVLVCAYRKSINFTEVLLEIKPCHITDSSSQSRCLWTVD